MKCQKHFMSIKCGMTETWGSVLHSAESSAHSTSMSLLLSGRHSCHFHGQRQRCVNTKLTVTHLRSPGRVGLKVRCGQKHWWRIAFLKQQRPRLKKSWSEVKSAIWFLLSIGRIRCTHTGRFTPFIWEAAFSHFKHFYTEDVSSTPTLLKHLKRKHSGGGWIHIGCNGVAVWETLYGPCVWRVWYPRWSVCQKTKLLCCCAISILVN